MARKGVNEAPAESSSTKSKGKGKEIEKLSTVREEKIPGVKGFPMVKIVTRRQKARFVELAGIGVSATRWLCLGMTDRLGLTANVRELFEGTGFGFLFGLYLPTYNSITLEFLSSFSQDRAGRISFRILNNDFEMSLSEFGEIFEFRLIANRFNPDEFSYQTLWGCIADRPMASTSKARINYIQHPVLRIFLRTLGQTIFGRAEPANSNKTELSILGSYLNVQRLAPWRIDLVQAVVDHFMHVATLSKVKSIEIGGIVTYIAEHLLGENSCGHLDPVADPAPLIDLDYIRAPLLWTARQRGPTRWVINSDHSIRLPCRHLPRISPFPPLALGEHAQLPSLLINHVFDRHGDDSDDDDVDVPPPQPFYYDTGAPASASQHASHPAPASAPYNSSLFAPASAQFYDFEAPERDLNLRFQIDLNLRDYRPYHANVQAGLERPPYVSFYAGNAENDGYPGRIFSGTGIRPEDYTPDFWERRWGQDPYGGQSSRNPDEGNDDDMGDDS